jgi:type II secretory pathway pseudopilin PulG
MILNRKSTIRQRGFTLVELMVAAALSITIMWILSESFKMGIDFARSARSTGDMMNQLNNVGQIMLRDLQANHFYVSQNGLAGDLGKLSSQRLDNMGWPPNNTPAQLPGTPVTTYGPYTNPGRVATGGGYFPPQGYFQIFSPPPSAQRPGILNPVPDNNGEGFLINTVNGPNNGAAPSIANATFAWNGALPSQTPFVRFTVFLPQGLPQNVFTATTTAPGGGSQTYFSQAAEVAYFLGSPGPNTNATGLGTPTGHTLPIEGNSFDQPPQGPQPRMPLYNLYRRVRLVAQTSDYQASLDPALSGESLNTINELISFTPLVQPIPLPQYQVNTLASFGQAYVIPTSVAPIPANRVLMQPLQFPSRLGDDVLLSNVLSFEVLACWTPPTFLLIPPTPQFPHQLGNGLPVQTPFPNGANTAPMNSDYPFDHLPTWSVNNTIPAGTFDTWFVANQPYPLPVPGFMTQWINWNWDNFYEINNPGPLYIPPANPKGKPRFIQNIPNPNIIPMPLRISALQFTVRIYDPKTKQTRQNTWRVAM